MKLISKNLRSAIEIMLNLTPMCNKNILIMATVTKLYVTLMIDLLNWWKFLEVKGQIMSLLKKYSKKFNLMKT